jgi:ubiquinone/menaquinone biosynthesis C-methylase UbiE
MNYYDKIAKSYHELHSEEQAKKMKVIKSLISPKKSESLLDVGCGTGLSSDWKCNVVGVDPSFGLVTQGKGNRVQGFGEHLPFQDSSFDYIICVTALGNFSDVEKGLKEMKRVGKGKVVVSFLKRSSKSDTIMKAIKKVFTINETVEEEKDIILLLE